VISFESKGLRFNYRVVGAAFRKDEVLLHRSERDDFWSLPGGRGEIGETSLTTLVREMAEELEVEVEVKRLLWVVENFFEYEGTPFHEIAFYFHMELPEDSPIYRAAEDVSALDHGVALTFRWFKLARLDSVTIYPTFLKESLRDLPERPVHLVHRD
jgi:ADP-ribose pyrophosphatase YjhB (NUDIX family)